MSPLELVDDRFDKLARELRAAQPVASPELRERIEALTPPRPRRTWPSLRRLAPAVALGGLAASLGAAAVIGVVHSGSSGNPQTRALQARTPTTTTEVFGAATGTGAKLPAPSTVLDANGHALSPAPGRLQQYDASLTLRVKDADELSRRTQQAMRLTRSLGGYVASASFDVPGRQGVSTLVLRVPIDRVQRALAQFAGYGTLLSQKISVRDLQQRVDAQAARIAALRRSIAAIEERLRGELSLEERGRLEQLLAVDEARLAALQKSRAATVRRAELSRVALTLVTPRPQAGAAPSRLDRTLDDAGSVLARELEILLYALVVAGPLLIVGGAAIALARAQRRRSDRRLLERT